MTQIIQNEITHRLRQILDEEGLSQTAIAKEMGMSGAALSLYLSGTYKGDNVALEQIINRWLTMRENTTQMRVLDPELMPFVETPTAKNILAVYHYNQVRGGLGTIVSGAGLSKTRCARYYKERAPNVWYVDATWVSSTPAGFLREIAQVMNVQTVSALPADLYRGLCEKMSGSRGLLIIDEGQYLHTKTLQQITCLRDASRCGIVIQGNERILGGMQSALAQVSSRVGKRLMLTKPTPQDLDAMLRGWEQYMQLPPDALGGPIQQFFSTLCQKEGSLRLVSETLTLAYYTDGEKIDLKSIRAAWRQQGGAST
jgi:DNA transposition AAA+ family ATPase